LKTPLAKIREGTDLLADGSVGNISEQQREVLDILQSNSLGLQKKIENLLNFNAWQNMKTRPQVSECRLSEVFDHALQHHRLAMTRLGLFADIKMPDIRVNADYEKLRLMFDNLISNALKFSPPGGTLYCRARREGGGVAIDVADEGPGIAAGERDRIFEPFYEGRQPQKGPLRGTGIGLSVVRECVKAHGGTIEIREGEYPGAHFHIHLAI
jgi:two-component system sensor histidine kinase GlrK